MSHEPNTYELTSKKGWTKIGYDPQTWIPCPRSFPPDMTEEEWARGFAAAWWKAVPGRHGDRPVQILAESLSYIHDNIYATQPCHVVLIHLPDPRMPPLPVCFGIWQSAGERDTQLRVLVHADDPAAAAPPAVEQVWTEQLGAGLRCRYRQRTSSGEVMTALNYAWRSEEHETDLRVFCGCPEAALQRAFPDIEALIQQISIVPSQGWPAR